MKSATPLDSADDTVVLGAMLTFFAVLILGLFAGLVIDAIARNVTDSFCAAMRIEGMESTLVYAERCK